MEDIKYIGAKQIKEVNETDGVCYVLFNDEGTLSVPKKLFDLIVTTKPQEGEYRDIVLDKIARYLIAEIAGLDVPYGEYNNVMAFCDNIINNFTKEKIGEKFGYRHMNEIKLSDILS
jgi:hypothetical protein